MLTFEDTVGLSDLSEGEVLAIAEHEHTAPIIASGIGSYLIQHHKEQIISLYILEDLIRAQRHGDQQHQTDASASAESVFRRTPYEKTDPLT